MQNLQNHFLVAMPQLNDGFFERSVVYICEHNSKGAMGIVINRPHQLSVRDLLKQMKQSDVQDDDFLAHIEGHVMLGGPLSTERGFVLHTPQQGWNNSIQITDEIMLTTSRDVLTSLGTSQAPNEMLIALGYTGWVKDQLEQEIADNYWLTLPADPAIVFATNFDEKWQQATRPLGFDVWQVSHQAGHA